MNRINSAFKESNEYQFFRDELKENGVDPQTIDVVDYADDGRGYEQIWFGTPELKAYFYEIERKNDQVTITPTSLEKDEDFGDWKYCVKKFLNENNED